MLPLLPGSGVCLGGSWVDGLMGMTLRHNPVVGSVHLASTTILAFLCYICFLVLMHFNGIPFLDSEKMKKKKGHFLAGQPQPLCLLILLSFPLPGLQLISDNNLSL